MRFLSLVLILVFCLKASAETAPRPEISILPNEIHEVSAGLPILLRDVGAAGFVSEDLKILAQDMKILEGMKAGEEKTFSNAEMVRVLKEKVAVENKLTNLNWTYFVPEKITFRAKSILPQNRISTMLMNDLSERCEACRFQFRDLKVPVLKENLDLKNINIDTSGLRIVGSFLIPVKVDYASGLQKTYYVTGQLQTHVKALVSTRALQVGDSLDSKDYKEQEIEISFSQDALAVVDDLKGKTLNKMLAVGRPIYKSDLKKEMVVQRGQLIRAISGDETFEVSAQMQAEENGAVGDLIRMKNTETQKLMSGRVIERGVVRIQ